MQMNFWVLIVYNLAEGQPGEHAKKMNEAESPDGKKKQINILRLQKVFESLTLSFWFK